MRSLIIFSLFTSLLFIENLSAQDLAFGYPDTRRTKMNVNQDWKFHLGDPEANYYTRSTTTQDWEVVHLPHTLELTSLTLDGLNDEKTQLVFHRKVGWYKKELVVTAESL